MIDFGRELYLPWRLSEGEVLYRDLNTHFGPLSQYFNSLLFSAFGPGLMVLVFANLIIFGGILSLFYLLCRRAWGPVAAVAGTSAFIAVFGFSQLVGAGNYNYAAPYAHETTHGLLVSLGLVCVLTRWVSRTSAGVSFFAGLLYGVCFLLKPEFILAGAVVTAAAVALRLRSRLYPRLSEVSAGFLGLILPTLGFGAYFARFVSLDRAFGSAAGAWLPFVSKPHENFGGIQNAFSGLDRLGAHFAGHAVAAAASCVLLAGLFFLASWLLGRLNSSLGMILGLCGSVVIAWVSWSYLDWFEVGRALFGLTLIYVLFRGAVLFLKRERSEHLRSEISGMLLALLGLSMMARMILNGRIYHYGFYQASIAGSLLVAVLFGELPRRISANAREQMLVMLAISALLIPGVVKITMRSQALLRTKTVPVGEGSDRFYAYSREMEPTGEIVGAVAKFVRQQKPRSLIVIPEGIMINYLARVPSRLPHLAYGASSPQLIAEFESRPPEEVILISRNLGEYGVERFGATPGRGQEILSWLSQSYGQIAHVGGDPLDVQHQRGAVIFRRIGTQ